MRNSVLFVILTLITTQLWASGVIDCRFQSQNIYKLSVVLNEGSNGINVQWLHDDFPDFTYIDGRDEEMVSFLPDSETQQLILKASSSTGPKVGGVFTMTDSRWAEVELTITQDETTKIYYGRCFVVNH